MAQTWPSKPVRLIVPFPAGAAPDVIARLVADRLGTAWGQAVFVDNRPGAGGIPGMAALVRSPADGYTLGFVPAAVVTLTPELYKNPQFNLDTDLVPVAAIGTSPMMIVVNQSSDIKTLADLVKAAKAQPGKVNFAAAQTNSVPHLTGEMLGRATGTSIFTVPYSGSAAASTALLANEVAFTVDGLPALTQYVKAGKFRALAVTSHDRLPGFENVPAAGETVKGFESLGWFSIYAPTGTPVSVIEQVNRDINKVIQAPDLVARLADLGVYPKPGTPKALGAFVQEQRSVWKKAVADLGLQPQ
ncbi:tripartite tricarboxylate transporter substrate binding protein [Polaromonas sp.]|uniref:Bug family tripartite tricarboxylate transporter substrate binding protein n=1 Tax=Polaromonas sp. TaxID=1869339 RepID=UPI00286A061E|nr:tripartite tricarboxylate transporter substrate binding protein [Polaromonas sp.]